MDDAPFFQYQTRKRRQMVTRTIWITTAACLAFGAFNLNLASWSSAAVILASAAACLVAVVLNYRGRQTWASLLVCLAVLSAITYSIYDGDGLLDPGIIGYSLFVLLGTLLLDKRYTFWLTLAAILCLTFVGVLQANGYLHPTIHILDAGNVLPISLFLIVGALIVWVILDNLQKNYERLRASEGELREAYELTIRGWSRALDIRDQETGEHSLRVVAMAERLAQAMGYPADALPALRYGAYLHDIGKIGIPDAILHKPGPLTEAEWVEMRTHPLKAEAMLSGIAYLRPAVTIPKYHHERWDGGGYPERLSGLEIPLAARIFAIVDVWDALSNDRPYRAAWPPEKVRAYLQEQAGQHFDPEVVRAFLPLLDAAGAPAAGPAGEGG